MKNLSAYDNQIKRVNVIGVPISIVNMDMVLKCIQNDMNTIRKNGDYICVSNVHTTVMAHDNSDYKKVQKESYLSVPDGMPLVLIAQKQFKEMGRVAGLDLMKEVFNLSREKHFKHFFYGNTKDNLQLFIGAVHQNYPWVDVVGYEPSLFRDLSECEKREISNRINRTNADIVWVALGAPKQEFFCNEMKGKIHALMIGVGGVFNIVAGIVPDAPIWMKNHCFEWLFRLLQEPKRLFKRYIFTNAKFIYLLIKGE